MIRAGVREWPKPRMAPPLIPPAKGDNSSLYFTINSHKKQERYTETGNNEYYTCSVCQKVFKDAAGTQETTVEAETIAKLTRPSSGGSSSHGDRDPSYAVTAPSTKNGDVPY